MAHKNKTNISPFKTNANPRKGLPSRRFGKHRKPHTIFTLEEANDRLADIFRNHDFELVSHEQRRLLAKFYRLLMENQERENFTRLLTLRDVALKHFIDSIIILEHTELQFPLLDLGTGPGLPGIPLKIMFPEEKIILAEGVQKRVAFLKTVRDELDLKRLEIIGRNINKDFLYPVKGVITRAVEDLGNTLGNVINSVEIDGRVYFMKGPGVGPEIPDALDRYGEFYELEKDIAYEIPKTPHQRRLVIFRKIRNPDIINDED